MILISKRFMRQTKSFAERQAAAARKARAIASRRCPGCGSLCATHNGNAGTRARCERCGA